MPPESTFKNWTLRGLPKNWHAQTVETTTGRGIPDVNLCTPLGEVWIEFKADRIRPHLRPEQYAWIMRRNFCGGAAVVLHKTDEGWSLHSPLTWLVVPRGDSVEIVSPPFNTGTTTHELAEAIYNFQNARTTASTRN